MKKYLDYSIKYWKEIPTKPVNTLQFFITNQCNLRCKACFYAHKLGKKEMSFKDYSDYITKYEKNIDKIIILGGEPTLHKDLPIMIKLNQNLKLKTTVYTNGFNLKNLENINLNNVTIRIGVYGSKSSEKPLNKIKTKLPVTIVYMLRKDNVKELMETAKIAEKKFNCKDFYISSIRDISITGNYWHDTKDTISNDEYFKIVQDFIQKYKGKLNLHIALRGVIKSKIEPKTKCCRFGNIFPDKTIIQCPLDISLKKTTKKLNYGKNKCNKDKRCILRKMILQRKV
ncbi:MAG: radical SAM protein [archaeon]